MVAMNPQTWDADVAEIEPGGYLFYDNTKPLPTSKFRDDIHVIGMPLTEICNATYSDPRQRQLFKNIIYVGALSALLGHRPDGDREADRRAVQGQGEAARPQHRGAAPGPRLRARRTCRIRSACACSAPTRSATASSSKATAPPRWAACTAARRSARGIRSRRRRRWPRRSRSTARSAASTRRPARTRYAIVQAEDEIASIGMVVGAGWNGARAFTATSGPGISLMTEFIGLAYFAEIPVTIIDVQRGGPSTGMPTRTQQSDMLACAYASHGDTKHVLLFPEDPHECFEFAAAALDLADRLQTPVFVMTDLDIGMNQRLCEPFAWDDARGYDRGKVMTRRGPRGRHASSAATRTSTATASRTAPIPARIPTQGALLHPRHHASDPHARYSEAGPDYIYNMQRLLQKFDTAKALVPQPVADAGARSRRAFGAIYFGSTSPAMDEALERAARARASRSTRCALRAFPFPDSVREFIAAHDAVFVVEQNRDAQLRTLLVNEFGIDPARLVAGAALRRHADHRALHRRRDRAARRRATCGCRAGGGRAMTYLAKPKLHHPDAAAATRSATRAATTKARSRTLCAGCGHDSISRRDHPGLLGARHRAAPRRQALGHRLQRRRRPTTSSATRTASTPCTGACRRC